MVSAGLTKMENMLARGPYGCRKTSTIASLITAFWEHIPTKRIAIVSETNAAIDEDLKKLLSLEIIGEQAILRLGTPRGEMMELENCPEPLYWRD